MMNGPVQTVGQMPLKNPQPMQPKGTMAQALANAMNAAAEKKKMMMAAKMNPAPGAPNPGVPSAGPAPFGQ